MSAGATDPPPAPRRLLRLAVPLGVVAILVAALAVFLATRGSDPEPTKRAGAPPTPSSSTSATSATAATSTGRPPPTCPTQGQTTSRTPSRTRLVAITAADRIPIAAKVTEPSGTGRHPLVIMPASSDANYDEYTEVGRSLTAAGFVTVSYTQRGYFTSGGQIDFAGAKTRQDARTVIDWALRNTASDVNCIGMLGISYGAGISLLTAAVDERVRAVVAMSTWTDLVDAFHPNDTVNVLGLNSEITHERSAAALTRLASQLRDDPIGKGGDLDAFFRPRSPSTYVAQLNRNRPAIMLANGWQDSLFSPAGIVSFYNRLTTPKRLQLSLGDHIGPEQQLLAGQRSPTGDAALAWLRHYLGGESNGIEGQAPVQLQDVTTKTIRTYPRWPRVAPTKLALAAPSPARVAITTRASTWSAPLVVGQDTGADIGQSQFVPSSQYKLPTVAVRDLPADRASVWAGEPVSQPTRITGAVNVSVSVAATSPNATLFTYLYDTGPDGTGSLMAMTPYTATGTDSGTPVPVSFALEPIAWTLPAGHQLTVVVDTVEPWWTQAAPPGSTITLSSTAAHPAGVSVPIG